MTGNKILLDTNIISALLKGEVLIAENIDQSDEVYIPVIVIGELYYGALYSTQIKKNIANIITLSERYSVISADAGTAQAYGTIKATLKKQGTPIPENDMWIAAIAKQYELKLVTRDKHFDQINGLDTLRW